jgi:predicted glutamine amidotransferase
MCQLLGMNCNIPTDICFSFTGFRARGGRTDVHQDGWGIAFFEGKGVRLFLDPLPSSQSPVAELVKNFPIKSKNVVAHIRKATHGVVALENTHPFKRELWGNYWIFAHNGNVPDFNPILNGAFTPVGGTDSERAFCWLMQELRRKFPTDRPEIKILFQTIHDLTMQIADIGEFNFLLTNGDLMIAHASTNLCYVIRKAPFPKAALKDEDISIDLSEVTTETDRVAIIATTPLTQNEKWIWMEPGSLWLFSEGNTVEYKKTISGPTEKILPQQK